MKRLSMLAVFALVLALVLSACAPPPTQPALEGAEQATEPAAEEPAAGEAAAEVEPTATPIVAEAGTGALQLIYWNGLTGSDGATMVQIVESFTQENPDVSVRVEMMPWNIYFDKLLTSLVSGNPPDIFLLHEYEIPQFASQGVLRDTGDFYQEMGGPIPEQDFIERTLDAVSYQGTRYGVPLDIHGWGLWYNKDLFEAAGLDPNVCPATGEEYIEMARQLTLDANGNNATSADFDPENVKQWGTAVSWFKVTFLSALYQYGGDWTDGQGKATLNSDAAVQAASFWNDLIYKEHVAPQPAGFDTWQSFAGGTLAMLSEGSWMLNFNNDNGINWGVCPFPQIGDQPAVWTSSHVMYTPTTLEGEKLEAAKKLIAYISDHGLVWATSGQPPARTSQQEAMTSDEFPSATVLGESFREFGRYDTAHECIQEVILAYEPELDAIYNNVKTLEQGLNDANSRVQDILDRCQ